MNLILFEEDSFSVSAEDPRYEHLKQILKKGEGDVFAAGVINGKKGTAVIESFNEKECVCRFEPLEESLPLYPFTLIVGMVRPITARRLLKDLTTLGVGRILFAQTELTDRSYRSGSLWRPEEYRKYLIEGAVQAGETRLPEVGIPYSLKAALSEIPECPTRIVFDNRGTAGGLGRQTGVSFPAVAAVGSERGWTDRERVLFAENGFTFCSMGKRILRTETAAAVAAALLLEHSGEW